MPDSQQPVSADLISAAQRGSGSALGEMLNFYRSYLLATASRRIGGELRAKVAPSDLVQETLLAAQHRFAEFRGETEAELLAWLRQILRNELVESRRRFASRKRDIRREIPLTSDRDPTTPKEIAASDPSPSGALTVGETDDEIEAAIRRLPPDYQAVVRFRYWDRLTTDEIAAKMNRSSEAVRKIWSRAIRRIATELNHESADADPTT